MNEKLKQLILNYINAYNEFDIDRMLEDLHEDVQFKNINNGEVNLELSGKEAFKKQAIAAKSIFQTRQQKITTWIFEDQHVKVKIDYNGVLANNLPNGMKAGDTIELKGQSFFEFKNDKIIKITDQS